VRRLELRRALVAGALLSLLPLTACGGGDDKTITVLAASSLTGTFTELGREFEKEHSGVTVKFAFDSSATLAQQATGGAPADVLATADPTTMHSAESAQAGTPKTFATNRLVLVTPADDPGQVTAFSDLDKSSVQWVMCVPTAPCGIVADALLRADHISGKPVSQEVDVKSVLAKLTEGEADAGIVYVTDVKAAGDKVTGVPIPADQNGTTAYPIATLTGSRNKALAAAFVSYVESAAGQRVLTAAGFSAP